MTTQPSLDSILSGRSETAPETTPPPIIEKFETPADPPQGAKQETEGAPPQEPGESQPGQKMVPHEALHKEKEKVKRYTEQVASFEQRLAEQNQAWDRRFTELLERVAPRQPQKQTDWFDNPDDAFRQRGEQLVGPIAGQVQQLAADLAQIRAERIFGDTYGDFLTHVREAMGKGDPEVQALSAMMNASPEPFRVAKDWWDKRTFDPAAERERIRDDLRKELGVQQQPQQPALPVMPSNLAGARNVGARSGPAWAGPPRLADIFKR